MAKEIAVAKRAKISQAQQYMLLAVLGAGIVLGAAISIVMHFMSQISFNARVISEEDKAIATYSDAIKNIGICKKPAGTVYTDAELKKCNPNNVGVESVPNTLRSNILETMAANDALNSVPKDSSTNCLNTATGKSFTYAEMQELLNAAETTDEQVAVSDLIQNCSALRIIPDALPAFKNEEALLASLNKIFVISNWEPEAISPTGTSAPATFGTNLNTFSVRLSVEADSATTMTVLNNIERSIREFNIDRATILWSSNDTLTLQAQATAYYMDPTTIIKTNKVVKAGGGTK